MNHPNIDAFLFPLYPLRFGGRSPFGYGVTGEHPRSHSFADLVDQINTKKPRTHHHDPMSYTLPETNRSHYVNYVNYVIPRNSSSNHRFSVANMWTIQAFWRCSQPNLQSWTVFHWKKLEICWTYPCIQPPRSIPEPLSETRNCSLHNWKDLFLVGGFSPSHEKYAQVKMGEHPPQIEANIEKNAWNR